MSLPEYDQWSYLGNNVKGMGIPLDLSGSAKSLLILLPVHPAGSSWVYASYNCLNVCSSCLFALPISLSGVLGKKIQEAALVMPLSSWSPIRYMAIGECKDPFIWNSKYPLHGRMAKHSRVNSKGQDSAFFLHLKEKRTFFWGQWGARFGSQEAWKRPSTVCQNKITFPGKGWSPLTPPVFHL